MNEIIKGLQAGGLTTNFEFLNNTFCAVDSRRTFRVEELSILEHYCFEGGRVPDDESSVYAIETSDGTRGTIADAYGVFSNPLLKAFKVKMCQEK